MTLRKRSHYAVTVDCVVFCYQQNELKVALIQRKNPPFKGAWAIPGGFLEGSETIEEAAKRELSEETGLHDIYLEQFQVFSEPDRDPRGRVISVGLFALIAADKLPLTATQDAARAEWFPAYDFPALAFDHEEIYAKALAALRKAVRIQPLVFELLPKEFTLTMLQQLYEQIFDRAIDKRNFRKAISKLDFIQETGNVTRGTQYRPARLYRFNKMRYKQEPRHPVLSFLS